MPPARTSRRATAPDATQRQGGDPGSFGPGQETHNGPTALPTWPHCHTDSRRSVMIVDHLRLDSPTQFRALQRGRFPAPADTDLNKVFAHPDVNGDDQLSAEEFIRAIIEFWTSSDPDAPGDWCMGHPTLWVAPAWVSPSLTCNNDRRDDRIRTCDPWTPSHILTIR
jgi:hypothetical protein